MSNTLKVFLSLLAGLLVVFAALYFIPWSGITWGKIENLPGQTVTVTGEAKQQLQNQIATFTAGVDSVSDNKDTAVAEVNDKVASMTAAVKKFGIEDKDIKTQNLSIYRQDEMYYDNGVQKSRPGQWRVSNSIEITLREVANASALADLLASSGATNVYGPNFMVDDTKSVQEVLLKEALVDAGNKAQYIANSTGRKLGKVLNVTEGTSSSGVSPMDKRFGMGGGGSPVEPGTATVSTAVTVTYQLQ